MLDTKSKNIYKKIVYTLSIIIIAGLVSSLFFLAHKMTNSMEIVVQKDYYQSFQLKEETTSNIYRLAELLNVYKSEENILEGNTVFTDEYDLSWNIRSDYEDFESDYMENKPEADDSEIMNAFVKTDTEEIREYKAEEINRDLRRYKEILTLLEQKGIQYYIECEEVQMTNVPKYKKDDFTSRKVFYTFDSKGSSSSFDEFDPYFHSFYVLEHFPQDTLYMCYDDTILENQVKLWQSEQGIYRPSIIVMFSLAFGLLIGFIYLAYDYKDEYFPWIKNSLYFDLRVMIYLCLVVSLILIGAESYRILGLYFVIPASLIVSLVTMNLYLSIIKHVHDRNFLKKHLTIQLILKLFGFLMLTLSKLPTIIRMTPTPHKARDLKRIISGVKNIKDGDLDHIIETDSIGLYRTLANDINSITDGLKAAVGNELKSDRMRTELISNVSHDIRTPLTSIITYVDLMKRTENEEEKTKYLEIIDQKSQRLKNLTDDLFEASKVNSGNIPVQLETIDLQALLTQCLGELNEKMEDTSLDFSINYYQHHRFVIADGSLMFRIIENLMSNIFKYSLENSRVYINIEEDESHLILVFKNISAYPLNMNPDELFERFKRGDESRTTEGSGLGLSITENLIKLQRGIPEIQIDGDLFKFIVKLRKADS